MHTHTILGTASCNPSSSAHSTSHYLSLLCLSRGVPKVPGGPRRQLWPAGISDAATDMDTRKTPGPPHDGSQEEGGEGRPTASAGGAPQSSDGMYLFVCGGRRSTPSAPLTHHATLPHYKVMLPLPLAAAAAATAAAKGLSFTLHASQYNVLAADLACNLKVRARATPPPFHPPTHPPKHHTAVVLVRLPGRGPDFPPVLHGGRL